MENSIGEGFSSIDLVGQCLIDTDKAAAFDKAIKKKVKSDSIVLEFGTGSGILSMFAARAGARKVFAVEFDPYIASVAKQNFINNNLEDKIELIIGDARNINLKPYLDKVDIVLMEMLSTAMVDEYQVQAMNNLHNQGLIGPETSIIPEAQETEICLSYMDFSLYGLDLKMVRHLWQHDHNDGLVQILSKPKLLNSIFFKSKTPINFSCDLSFEPSKEGLLNSLRISSTTIVDKEEGLVLASTHSMNPLVVIPVQEKMINRGENVNLNVSYEFGGSYKKFIVI